MMNLELGYIFSSFSYPRFESDPTLTYASNILLLLLLDKSLSSRSGNSSISLQHLYPSIESAIASEVRPVPCLPKTNTGFGKDCVLKSKGFSLVNKPIFASIGKIEYELSDL